MIIFAVVVEISSSGIQRKEKYHKVRNSIILMKFDDGREKRSEVGRIVISTLPFRSIKNSNNSLGVFSL